MTETKKMAALLITDTATETRPHFTTGAMPKPELKWKRILRAMLYGTLNRFDAERHSDHCLNSTVAELRRDRLVSIAWVWEEVPSLGGRATAHVKRYWVDRGDASMDHARTLLGVGIDSSPTAS